MPAIEVAAIIAVAVWLAVMTVMMLLVFRQVSLITAWMQQRSPGEGGLDAGAEVPDDALALMPELRENLGYVLFLAGNCSPCREFALDAARSETILGFRENAKYLAAVAGDGRQAEEIAGLLPDWVRVVRGDDAQLIKDQFDVRATPAVYEVERGNVTGGAVAGYGIVNFENLIEARQEGSDAAQFAGAIHKRNGGGPEEQIPEVGDGA
jgi:hypothetical protein